VTWPATRKQLYKAGYTRAFHISSRPCKRCSVRIEFWITPEKKLMPLEEHRGEKEITMLCHFNTCPHADEFRKTEEKTRPIQKELFS
jgi:hypothetical protein